jgi:hypothetical protein
MQCELHSTPSFSGGTGCSLEQGGGLRAVREPERGREGGREEKTETGTVAKKGKEERTMKKKGRTKGHKEKWEEWVDLGAKGNKEEEIQKKVRTAGGWN